MSLTHCLYTSIAAPGFAQNAHAELVRAARAHNAAWAITGVLVYAEGIFFQVLEGDAEPVDDLFLHIAGDKRHHGISEVVRERILRRTWSADSMAYLALTHAQLGLASGYGDSVDYTAWLRQLDGERARRLSLALARGSWRAPGPDTAASA